MVSKATWLKFAVAFYYGIKFLNLDLFLDYLRVLFLFLRVHRNLLSYAHLSYLQLSIVGGLARSLAFYQPVPSGKLMLGKFSTVVDLLLSPRNNRENFDLLSILDPLMSIVLLCR